MCHSSRKPLFVKAVKRAQLRYTLPWPAWLPGSSKLWPCLAQQHRACSHFASPPLPLLHLSAVALAARSCLWLSPHTETAAAIHKVKTFGAQMGWKHFSFWMGDGRRVLVTPVSPGSAPGGECYLHIVCPQQLQACLVLFSLPNNPLGGFCFAWSN